MSNYSYMNESVYLMSDEAGSDNVDLNVKYNLYIIVPVIWSLIFIFGFLGNVSWKKIYSQLILFFA